MFVDTDAREVPCAHVLLPARLVDAIMIDLNASRLHAALASLAEVAEPSKYPPPRITSRIMLLAATEQNTAPLISLYASYIKTHASLVFTHAFGPSNCNFWTYLHGIHSAIEKAPQDSAEATRLIAICTLILSALQEPASNNVFTKSVVSLDSQGIRTLVAALGPLLLSANYHLNRQAALLIDLVFETVDCDSRASWALLVDAICKLFTVLPTIPQFVHVPSISL